MTYRYAHLFPWEGGHFTYATEVSEQRLTLTFESSGDDDGYSYVYTLPLHREVCAHCRGTGGCSCHLGSFTSDDMHELGLDAEWSSDYASGQFDRECEECHGDKVTLAIDPSAEQSHPDEWVAYWQCWTVAAEHQQAKDAEMRAGA